MKIIKKLIRALYWKFGHDGDKWQMRLVMFHIGKIIRTDGSISNGEFILSQINEMNAKHELVAEISFPKLKGIMP